MQHTSIEWVRNPDGSPGFTFNPITGCLNHVNGMCKGGNFPCYAYRLANTRLFSRYMSNPNVASHRIAGIEAVNVLDPFYPRFWPDRCNRTGMVMGKSPKGIFVCDMSDLFGIGIPEDWTHRVLDRCRDMVLHRFYLLTKQPQNLIKFSPFPENCYVGVTVCNDKMLDAAVDKLEDIQATIKYLSLEPLQERLTYSLDYALYYSGVSWVIIGAQTKPYKPPKIEWVQEIVEAADKAGVKVFLKDNLKPLFLNEKGFANVGVGALIERDIEKGGYQLRQETP